LLCPLDLPLSASRKNSSLYAAVNRRRSPLPKTSTSLQDVAPLLPVSISHSLLALYTKLLAGKCLIHIDREGNIKRHDNGNRNSRFLGSTGCCRTTCYYDVYLETH